jgi:hypothetical protein
MNMDDDELRLALEKIGRLLGARNVAMLARLLEDVQEDTRYGDVKVVVADGRVVGLRAEKSYKS